MENTPSENPTPVEASVVEPTLVEPPLPLPPTTPNDDLAQNYIARELKQARSSLLLTQIVSLLLIVLTAGYMGYMTWQVVQYSRPETAAEVANGIIAERVDLYGQQAADTFKTQIPQFISALPDQAIAAAPELRQNLVNQVAAHLDGYAQQHSQTLGENIDEFLEKNKAQVGAILEDGQSKATVAELGPELELQMTQFLQEKPAGGGESAQGQIDKSLQVLQAMKTRTDHLAHGKNLTQDEKNARLAIAIIGKTIERDTKGMSGEQLISEGGKNLREKLGSLGSPNLSGDDGLPDPKPAATSGNATAANATVANANAVAPDAAP